MKKMRTLLKRSLALGVIFILMCSLLAGISMVPASAKKKYLRPGKPVISVKQGETANNVVLSIGKTDRAEWYIIYMKEPGSNRYIKYLTLQKDGTAQRTVNIEDLGKKGTYYFKVRSFYETDGLIIASVYSKVKKFKVTDAITENLENLNTQDYPLIFKDKKTVYFGHYPHFVPEVYMDKRATYDYYEDYMHNRSEWAGTKLKEDPEGERDRIEWIVLEERDDSYLLMSKDVIDVVPMAGTRALCYFTTIEDDENYDLYKYEEEDEKDHEIVTWEDTKLRSWLNNEFVDYAFTASERNYLLQMQVDACGKEEGTCKDYVTIPSSANLEKYLKPEYDGEYSWDLIARGTQFALYSQYSENVGPLRYIDECNETFGYRVLRRLYHSGGSSTKIGFDWSGAKLDKKTYESLGCPAELLDATTVSYWLRDIDLTRHDELENKNDVDSLHEARNGIYKLVTFDGRYRALYQQVLYSSKDPIYKEGNISLFYNAYWGTGMSGLRPIILVAKDKVDVVVTPGKGGTIGATGKRNGNGGTGNKNNGDNNNNNNNNTKDSDEEKFTITFEANGGKGTMRSKTVKKGSTYSIPKCKFTRNGYSFDGWQLGSGKTIAPGKSIKVESDIILTATWKETNKINADYVFFGHYEQDGNKSNGKEPIEWMVLENKGDTLVLMSKQILVHRRFDENPDREEPVTWADCTMRTWLNKNFLNDAFTKAERNSILNRKWDADDNPMQSYGRSGGDSVKDKVSILSRTEVLEYFRGKDLTDEGNDIYSPRLVAIPTDAIVRSSTNKEGIVLRGFSSFEVEFYKDRNYSQAVIDGHYSDWWLRTPSSDFYNMLNVSYHGGIDTYGLDTRSSLMSTAGVRPVIEVQSSAVSVKKK